MFTAGKLSHRLWAALGDDELVTDDQLIEAVEVLVDDLEQLDAHRLAVADLVCPGVLDPTDDQVIAAVRRLVTRVAAASRPSSSSKTRA